MSKKKNITFHIFNNRDLLLDPAFSYNMPLLHICYSFCKNKNIFALRTILYL